MRAALFSGKSEAEEHDSVSTKGHTAYSRVADVEWHFEKLYGKKY